MPEEQRRPTAGTTFWNDEGEDSEVAEVLEDQEDGRFLVADEDGEQAVIKWNTEEARWEVDA